MNICTIITKSYVARARVLAESFKKHHPDGTCYALLVDETEGYIDPASEPFEFVAPADLNLEDFDHRTAIYDVVELSTSVKPRFLSHLLNERGMERVAYVDPDIRLYYRLDRLEELTRKYGLVLIPNFTSPIPRDGKNPSEVDILLAGTYNGGLIAMERGARTDGLLDWWSERLKTECLLAPKLGYCVDQRWMDLFPCLMPGSHVMHDPGHNVAYYNLHYRNLTVEKDRYYVNGEPLKSFHFTQYDPGHRDQLAKYQNRIQLHRGSALARICDEYAEALIAHGYNEVKDWPYTYNTLPNGVELDRYMRRLYQAGVESGELDEGSIFTPEVADRFVAWLDEPAPAGGKHGVTRYLYEVYSGRPSLRHWFPNLDGPDGAAFIKWVRSSRGSAKRIARPPASTRPSTFGRAAGFARRVLGSALGPP